MTNDEKKEAITAALIAEKMGDDGLLRETHCIITDENLTKIKVMGYAGGAVDPKRDPEAVAFLIRCKLESSNRITETPLHPSIPGGPYR